MPKGKFRSRTLRRDRTKLPGGKTVTHHKKRSPSAHRCASCGKELKGIPRKRPYKMKKLGISKKRPERPFGGYLCTECSRDKIKEEARK